MSSLLEAENVIYSYSRAQAIEDGVLADLSELFPDVVRQHYKYPLACTDSVWGILEAGTDSSVEDVSGRVHDLCWMARHGTAVDPTTRMFKVQIGRKLHTFKMVCGPGDNAEPVLTVMLPEED